MICFVIYAASRSIGFSVFGASLNLPEISPAAMVNATNITSAAISPPPTDMLKYIISAVCMVAFTTHIVTMVNASAIITSMPTAACNAFDVALHFSVSLRYAHTHAPESKITI